MTDEKMIEEMAQCMANCEITCDECFEQVESVMTMKIKQRENHCQAYKFAKTLFSAGYRNCKDKVVLTKEEYEMLLGAQIQLERKHIDLKVHNDICMYENETLKQELVIARKETAREVIAKIIWYAVKHIKGRNKDECFIEISFEKIDEIAKEYGVEIEE